MNKEIARINLEEKGIEELIPIYETTDGKKVTDGRELWSGLGVKAKFSDWVKSNLESVDAVENVDFTSFPFKTKAENTWITTTEYILTLDIAKEIVMIAGAMPRANQELKDKSKAYRKYFIRIEDAFKEAIGMLTEEQKLQLSIFNAKDKDSAIVASSELDRYRKRQIEEKDIKIVEDAPYVALAKKRLDKNGLISITDANKTFECKKGQITRWCKSKGYLHKTNTEVNQLGEEYFRVYMSGLYRCIGINENGLKMINDNLEVIKAS